MRIEPISFLLGCERSGSTWVANILDAHAGVELVMEPFAPYASIFPGFPDRHVHVATSSETLEESVRRGLSSTLPMKYPLLYRPGRAPGLRTVDEGLVHAGHRVYQKLLGKSPLACERWELLNLNHRETPADLRVRKEQIPAHYVVKELRLNLKVPVLRGTFPGARYVVIVRNPAAQLTSIRRWLEQGRLGELAASLKTLSDDVAGAPELRPFREWPRAGDSDDLLVMWWFLNYGTLLSDLRRTNASYLLIRHEELAAEPAAGTEALLSFLGLPNSQSVSRYLERSTGAEPRTSSPVDTFRKSAEHSRETIRAADRSLLDRLRRAADELPCGEELRGYFTDR